jgi:single-stranded-DNA-specific exonuclease
MLNWNKKDIPREVVKSIHEQYDVDLLTASILARRGITEGCDIQYYLEDDMRFLHSPFNFNSMEDAIDRIIEAKEEKEKVLIFGDRDVDGISSTTLLYNCLVGMGIDVQWKLPGNEDSYGLNRNAVESFAAEYGTLIITVDCGISNNEEIAFAAEHCIDVIILDHHNPPETLPSPAIIINPKLADSGYPFRDISGCAVVYKLVSALRFSKSDLYKQEICLLTVRPVNDAYTIDCLKIQNLIEKEHIEETVIPGTVSINQTRLPSFLVGQQIFVWDEVLTKKLLTEAFGTGIEFNLLDIRPQVAKIIPQTAGLSLLRLKGMSRLARYNSKYATEIKGFFNIFVSFATAQIRQQYPESITDEEYDLQLVTLAALADIMPLKNENRILVRHGLTSLNSGHARKGLLELLSHLSLLGKRVSSTDLSWNVIPVLNAAGRLGKPELAVQLFIENDPVKREAIALEIINLNVQRRQLGSDAWELATGQAEKSLSQFSEKLCVVIDERINRGVSGILAARLVQRFSVPAMAVTFVGENAVGSMRSCREYDITAFLDQMGDLFINHGGHNYAAGFSFPRSRLNEFISRLEQLAPTIELGSIATESVTIDAELPAQYLKPDLLKVIDLFEPYGEENPELTFMSSSLKIIDAAILGKTERQHLKLTLDCGSVKWPALFWGEAERLHRDFDKGDTIDILFQVTRNMFNGIETPQMILRDVHKQPNT